MKNEYDILKVFAILLVVIAHITALYTPRGCFSDIEVNALLSVFTEVIYIFHMPLFIALSGAIFAIGISKGKYKDFKPFLANKIKRIIIPYLFVGLVILTQVLMILQGCGITDCISGIYIWGGAGATSLVSWRHILVLYGGMAIGTYEGKPLCSFCSINNHCYSVFKIR